MPPQKGGGVEAIATRVEAIAIRLEDRSVICDHSKVLRWHWAIAFKVGRPSETTQRNDRQNRAKLQVAHRGIPGVNQETN